MADNLDNNESQKENLVAWNRSLKFRLSAALTLVSLLTVIIMTVLLYYVYHMEHTLAERGHIFTALGIVILLVFSISIAANLYIIQSLVIRPVRKLVKSISICSPGSAMPKINLHLRAGNELDVLGQAINLLEKKAEKIYLDPLTGINNRRYFDENLDRKMNSLQRSGDMLSLMMIDIDLFKKYNDTYGHSDGDRCLKLIAEALSETVTRADDFVARFGGEEFVVVLPHTNEQGAQIIAERILKRVRDLKIPHRESEVAEYVTVSIGVTSGRTLNAQNNDEFVRRADELLYMSKQAGRDRYTFGNLSA